MGINKLRSIIKKREGKGKRYYSNIKYPEIPISVADIYIITSITDRLDSLANKFYNDSMLWWVIAAANPGVIKGDGFGIKPGTQIRIPNNHEIIMRNFEGINNS